MAEFLRRYWRFFLGVCLAGLAMRLLLCHYPRPWDDDTDVYAELGRNLLRHGVYGIAGDDGIVPSLIRLPGYPLLLAVAQSLFPYHWLRSVLLLQLTADLGGCLLLAAFARRHLGQSAALAAFALGALCPFTAAYAATPLTESLSIFCVALGIYSLGLFFAGRDAEPPSRARATVLLGSASALAILLRPDGVLLPAAACVALLYYLKQDRLRTVALVSLLAVLPLAPWAVRNWRTFHVIQPLAPRHVNNPGEFVNLGFYRWMLTWAVDLSNTGQVYWQAGEGPIAVEDVPARAYDSAAQREQTAALIAEYNQQNEFTPELDAKFGALAAERIHAHPLRYYVQMPLWRVADMWLRPRTEALDLDVFWWSLDDHPAETVLAIELGLLNLVYVMMAVWALLRRRVPFAVFCLSYLLLRCLLLGTMENSEPRYTLEGFPILFLCAAAGYAAWRSARLARLVAAAQSAGV